MKKKQEQRDEAKRRPRRRGKRGIGWKRQKFSNSPSGHLPAGRRGAGGPVLLLRGWCALGPGGKRHHPPSRALVAGDSELCSRARPARQLAPPPEGGASLWSPPQSLGRAGARGRGRGRGQRATGRRRRRRRRKRRQTNKMAPAAGAASAAGGRPEAALAVAAAAVVRRPGTESESTVALAAAVAAAAVATAAGTRS